MDNPAAYLAIIPISLFNTIKEPRHLQMVLIAQGNYASELLLRVPCCKQAQAQEAAGQGHPKLWAGPQEKDWQL